MFSRRNFEPGRLILMSTATRSAALKNAAALQTRLAPHVTEPDFLVFADTGRSKGRPERQHIVDLRKLLTDVIAVAPKLSVSKTCLEAALLGIACDKKFKALPVAMRAQWAGTMQKRLKQLFRKAQQLRICTKPPAWFVKLQFPPTSTSEVATEGDEDEEEGEEEGEEEVQSQPDEEEDEGEADKLGQSAGPQKL